MANLITNWCRKNLEGAGCLACVGIVLLALALVFGILCLESWLVMLLWNATVVVVFGAPTIGFWMAMGFILLLRFILPSRSCSCSNTKN